MKTYYDVMDSPIGKLTILSNGASLTGLYMDWETGGRGDGEGERVGDGETGSLGDKGTDWIRDSENAVIMQASRQVTLYFSGELKEFDIPIAPEGTPFQKCVWNELLKIPYGHTVSYGELARRIGNPNGSRAVGLANGRNPISIIVPCHRVIGANGKLVGYGGGLERKARLLELEKGSGLLF
jgi:methylated-DNA-[protein]-cysteine S-methyltransferase